VASIDKENSIGPFIDVLASLCDETKILTDTETETFNPRQILPIPIPRLFSETKFSKTDTETFFPRPNFLRLIPRLFSETNFFDTDTETLQKKFHGSRD